MNVLNRHGLAMKRILSVILGLIILTAAEPGLGGEQLEWWPDLPELSDSDRAWAKKTGRVDMTGRPVGTVLTWQNPDSGNAGTVELVENLVWQGRDCRRLIHQFDIVNQPSQRVEFVTCLMADGEWKWPTPPKRL